MFNKLKNRFKRRDLEFSILNSKLGTLMGYLKPKSDVALMRHLLGSIDLSDIKDEMSESERREYCASIFAIYPRLEKDIKKFLFMQLEESLAKAENWEQVIFGKGTFNGMAFLLERWKQVQAEHIENSKVKEKFDENTPIGEI